MPPPSRSISRRFPFLGSLHVLLSSRCPDGPCHFLWNVPHFLSQFLPPPLPSPPLLHPEAWIVLIGNYQITLFLKPSRGDPLHLEKSPRVHKTLLDWSVPASDCCPVTPFSTGHTLTMLDFSQCLRQAKLTFASGNLHCYSLCLERSSPRQLHGQLFHLLQVFAQCT